MGIFFLFLCVVFPWNKQSLELKALLYHSFQSLYHEFYDAPGANSSANFRIDANICEHPSHWFSRILWSASKDVPLSSNSITLLVVFSSNFIFGSTSRKILGKEKKKCSTISYLVYFEKTKVGKILKNKNKNIFKINKLILHGYLNTWKKIYIYIPKS